MPNLKITFLLIAVIIIAKALSYSQEFQRLNGSDSYDNYFQAGIVLSHQYSTFFNGTNHFFAPSAVISALYDKIYYVSASFPTLLRIKNTKKPNEMFMFSVSDPRLELGVIPKAAELGYRAGLFYIFPLGVWNQYEAGINNLISGSGFHKFGIECGISRTYDPLAMLFKIRYTLGLPRSERFGWAMDLGEIMLDSTIVNVVNAETAFLLGFQNIIRFPKNNNGIIHWDDTSYGIQVSISILIYNYKDEWKIGVAKNMSEFLEPLTESIEYDHKFTW